LQHLLEWKALSNIDPIQMLAYSAVLNGIISAPVLIFIIKIANEKRILEDKINGKLSNTLGLLSVIVTILSVEIMFFSKLFKF
jgi:Mn2+/Fe2+ NRAMP family transporter